MSLNTTMNLDSALENAYCVIAAATVTLELF